MCELMDSLLEPVIDPRMKVTGLTEAKQVAGLYRRVVAETHNLPRILNHAFLIGEEVTLENLKAATSSILPDAFKRLRALKTKGATDSIANLRRVVADATSTPSHARVSYYCPDNPTALTSSVVIDYQPLQLTLAMDGLADALGDLDEIELCTTATSESSQYVSQNLLPVTRKDMRQAQQFEPSASGGSWVAIDPDRENLIAILNAITVSRRKLVRLAKQSMTAGGLFNGSGLLSADCDLGQANKKWAKVSVEIDGNTGVSEPAKKLSKRKKQGGRKRLSKSERAKRVEDAMDEMLEERLCGQTKQNDYTMKQCVANWIGLGASSLSKEFESKIFVAKLAEIGGLIPRRYSSTVGPDLVVDADAKMDELDRGIGLLKELD